MIEQYRHRFEMIYRSNSSLVYRIFLIILLLGMHGECQFGSFGFFRSNMRYSSVEFIIGFAILFIFGYILYERIPLKEIFIREKVLFFILLSFCISLLLSTVFASYKVEAVKYDIRIISNILLFYLLLHFLFRERLKGFYLAVLNAVGIAVSLICILRYLDWGWVNNAFSYWGKGSRTFYSASVFHHNNVFGNWLVLLIFITLGQFNEFPSRIYRIWLGVSLCLFTLSLALSLSRSAWVAFLVTGISFIFIKKRSKRLIMGAIALILLFLVAVTVHPVGRKRIMVDTIHRLEKLGLDAASSHRKIFYQSTALMIKQYPIFGIGLNNFKNRYHEFINAPPNDKLNTHNQYLNALAEQGIFGFCIFMLFVGYLVRLAIRNIKHGGNEFYALAIFAYLIGALFDYLWYDYSFIFMFWFVVILNIIEKRELEMRGLRN